MKLIRKFSTHVNTRMIAYSYSGGFPCCISPSKEKRMTAIN
jgi:hypothetical protein